MMLTFNMIQIAASLGIAGYDAALLQSIMSFSGMAGSIIFGWVADRIGGGRGMALVAFDSAVLLLLLQTRHALCGKGGGDRAAWAARGGDDPQCQPGTGA